eukprot:3890933-Amphidinium_carterae.1
MAATQVISPAMSRSHDLSFLKSLLHEPANMSSGVFVFWQDLSSNHTAHLKKACSYVPEALGML